MARMRTKRRWSFAVPAAADDYASVARNIIPSGQYGSAPPPAGADEQARMYDALTPLFNQVTADSVLRRSLSSSVPVDRFRLDRGLWASLKSWGATRRVV